MKKDYFFEDRPPSSTEVMLKDRVREKLLETQIALTQSADAFGEYGEFILGINDSKFRKWLVSIHRIYKKIRKTIYLLKVFFKKSFGLNRYGPSYNIKFIPYHVQVYHPSKLKRPRIMHAIQNFATGGSSQLVIDLIERLGHLFEQEVITGFLPNPPSYTGVPICTYHYSTREHDLVCHMERFNPAIVHVHYWGWGNQFLEWGWQMLLWYQKVFRAAKEFRVPVIENVNIPIEPYVDDGVKRYVYVSNYVKNSFGIWTDNEIVIYPGSDFNKFSRKNGKEVPDDCIGMVYRLDDDKLNESSIEVFIEIAKRRKNTNVLIVGGGRLLNSYRSRVRQAGVERNFEFTGMVAYNNLPEYYERFSIFVAPVWRESFGQVSPFAMSMGIPVIGYDVGAIKEVIGDESLLAPPGDVKKLADIIIKVLDDRPRRLEIGIRNSKRARDIFSVEAMCERYNTLYGEVLSDLGGNL